MIYLTADLHLRHANIIKYCNRPFTDVRHMNEILIENWNSTVSDNDIVFLLGDLSFGRTEDCLKKLNGNIIMIKGNHESGKKYPKYCIIRYREEPFYLVHDPKDIPKTWHGWSIHGHHHNNFPHEFPFVNFHAKRFNISVEMTDYRPISLDLIWNIAKLK